MQDQQQESATPRPPGAEASAFARGLTVVVSVPAAVLFTTALGFGALARDGGFSLGHAAFLTASMFAMPNQVILVDQLARNETIAAAALAVALTAMRLLPMTVTLVPLLRGQRRRPLLELLAAHFRRHHHVAGGQSAACRGCRASWRLAHFLGLGVAVASVMLAGTLIGYGIAAGLPPLLSAALLFTTPLYFILSLIATSRSPMDLAAVGLGCGLAPVFYLLVPGFDLLVTGLVGGTLAQLWRRTP